MLLLLYSGAINWWGPTSRPPFLLQRFWFIFGGPDNFRAIVTWSESTLYTLPAALAQMKPFPHQTTKFSQLSAPS